MERSGASSLTHDAENHRVVEQACVEFERDLKAFLLGMLRDVHLVDDAYQRTVVKAIQAAKTVNPETVRGWLFQIALNEVREYKRGTGRRKKLQRSVWEVTSSRRGEPDGDGWLHVTSLEQQEIIRGAISRLNGDYQEVVTRRIIKGQTFAVIADELNRPLGTVLTWMRRALNELREMAEIRQLLDE